MIISARSCLAIVLVLVDFYAVTSLAQEPESRKLREPWEWTEEERLEQRYDPESIWARNQAIMTEMKEEGADEHSLMAMTETPLVRIHGTHNPALFLPWELFQTLVRNAFSLEPETRESWRLIYRQQSQQVSLDDDFWRALESSARDYLEIVVKEQGFVRTLNQTSIEERPALVSKHLAQRNEQEQCKKMAEAFAVTRRELGEERLLKVLYEAVAPSTFMSHPIARGPEALLYIQGGCQ